jgi:SAM-dependent methyltransferase
MVAAPVSRRFRVASIINPVLLISALTVSVVMSARVIQADTVDSLGSWRNFYGVVRVQELGAEGWPTHAYSLVHGITVHGTQFADESKRDVPTTYYGPDSGVGLALLNYPRPADGMRVGVLGLGVGTLATYGLPGDVYRFYEINPAVIRLAEGEGGYFSFLQDSRAKIEIAPGDARLSLERELADGHPQNYDVLVLDVFSSDSIPVHLLDKEAFELYLQHLKPGGILVVHITNRHLDLVPVVWTLADHFGLSRVLVDDPGNYSTSSRSVWMLLARDPALLEIPALRLGAEPMDGYTSGIRLWTDDYSNLFQILK